MRRGFTLIELMVVMTIIALAASLGAPAIRSLIASSQQTKAIETFSSLLSITQSAAQCHFTRSAMRVERAFEVDDDGQLTRDESGNPSWLSHQQIRVLVFGHRQQETPIRGEERSFRQLEGSGVTALPSSVWLAPDYSLSPSFETESNWQAAGSAAAPIDTLGTFYIVFNRRGELARVPADEILYLDETQGNAFVTHPHPSARGAILYDRPAFEQTGMDVAHLAAGRPLYVNRYTASAVRSSP